MNRAEIEALVADTQTKFSRFVRDYPERAFFWGVLVGVALTITKSVVLPIGLVCVGLIVTFWFLDDSASSAEDVVSGQDRASSESESFEMNTGGGLANAEQGNAQESQLSSSYVPLKPSKSVDSKAKRKSKAKKKVAAGKNSKSSASSKAAAKSKSSAKSKPSTRKSSAATKSAAKKTGAKKKPSARKKTARPARKSK